MDKQLTKEIICHDLAVSTAKTMFENLTRKHGSDGKSTSSFTLTEKEKHYQVMKSYNGLTVIS